jgi:hypothetical protein
VMVVVMPWKMLRKCNITVILKYIIKLKSFYQFVIHERVVRFEVLKVRVMLAVCWDMMECRLVGRYM